MCQWKEGDVRGHVVLWENRVDDRVGDARGEVEGWRHRALNRRLEHEKTVTHTRDAVHDRLDLEMGWDGIMRVEQPIDNDDTT